MKTIGQQKKKSAEKSNLGNRPLQPEKSKSASAKSSPTHEQIALRAYLLWQQKGRPQGQEVALWLQAESEIKRGV